MMGGRGRWTEEQGKEMEKEMEMSKQKEKEKGRDSRVGRVRGWGYWLMGYIISSKSIPPHS